jgi:TP901 family phage tail tape measure protein
MADLTTNIAIKILDAFTGPLRKLGQGLEDAETRAKKFKNAMSLAADLNQASEAMGRFAGGILGPLKASVEEFASFEKAMSNVSALSGEMKGSSGFEALKAQAMELGAATAFSSQEAAEAMAVFAQAGRSVNEILAITPMTLAAAKANGTGLAETASIIGHTMSGMGIATKDTARVVDVLTASAAASDMSLSDLGTAMAYVAPLARQSGTSLEMTTAILGKLKDAGLEASSAGVGLRAIFSRLLDPSKEATRAFSKLGLGTRELRDLQRQVAGGKIDEALRRIGQAAAALPNDQRMKLLSQIFGMEASTAANVAISASMDTSGKGLGALNEQLHHVDGTTEKLAKVMEDNLAGAMERASGAISGLKTTVGEMLAPAVVKGASAVEGLTGAAQAFIKQQPKVAKATVELFGGLGMLALGLQGILTGTSALVSSSAYLGKAYGSLSTSIMGRFGLVAAAGAAGWAVGQWANEAFELDDLISKLLGRPRGVDKRDEQGISGDVQETRGGWRVNAKTGEVDRMGSGNAPASVRRAMAAGATTREEINAFIANERKQLPEGFSVAPKVPLLPTGPAPGSGTLLEQQARDASAFGSPLASVKADAEAAAATREQTAALLVELRRQTEIANAQRLEYERTVKRWNTAPAEAMAPW